MEPGVCADQAQHHQTEQYVLTANLTACASLVLSLVAEHTVQTVSSVKLAKLVKRLSLEQPGVVVNVEDIT